MGEYFPRHFGKEGPESKSDNGQIDNDKDKIKPRKACTYNGTDFTGIQVFE
jgi:hypothetical protein